MLLHWSPAGSTLDIEDAAGLSSARSACFPLDAAILDHCGRPLERWTRLQLPDGPMAQDFEPVRRSRASMTVGQTSIS